MKRTQLYWWILITAKIQNIHMSISILSFFACPKVRLDKCIKSNSLFMHETVFGKSLSLDPADDIINY